MNKSSISSKNKGKLPGTEHLSKKLITQIEEGSKRLAEDGGRVTSCGEKYDLLYKLIDDSGLSPDAIKTSHQTPTAEKTWCNSKIHFTKDSNTRKNQEPESRKDA